MQWDAGRLHQRPYAEARTVLNALQAVFNQQTVVIDQRHQIGDCANGHQIEQIVLFQIAGALGADQALGQPKSHSYPGQRFEGIAAIRAAWVDDGVGIGNGSVLQLMVIRNDEIELDGTGVRCLFTSARAAVHRDHQGNPTRFECVERGAVKAISLFEPVGNVHLRLRAERS